MTTILQSTNRAGVFGPIKGSTDDIDFGAINCGGDIFGAGVDRICASGGWIDVGEDGRVQASSPNGLGEFPGKDDGDHVHGGEGSAAAWGSASNDKMPGEDGDETLYGGSENDSMESGRGHHKLDRDDVGDANVVRSHEDSARIRTVVTDRTEGDKIVACGRGELDWYVTKIEIIAHVQTTGRAIPASTEDYPRQTLRKLQSVARELPGGTAAPLVEARAPAALTP